MVPEPEESGEAVPDEEVPGSLVRRPGGSLDVLWLSVQWGGHLRKRPEVVTSGRGLRLKLEGPHPALSFPRGVF